MSHAQEITNAVQSYEPRSLLISITLRLVNYLLWPAVAVCLWRWFVVPTGVEWSPTYLQVLLLRLAFSVRLNTALLLLILGSGYFAHLYI